MNLQKDWWKYLVVVAVVVGLVWYRNRQPSTSGTTTEPTPTQQTEQRANQFLQDAGITLPEGSERANLQDVLNSGATGVATRQTVSGKTQITVIASLPTTTQTYEAWLVNDQNQYMRLGALREAKGGYLLDFSGTNLENYNQVVVSRETAVGAEPAETLLKGTFGQ